MTPHAAADCAPACAAECAGVASFPRLPLGFDMLPLGIVSPYWLDILFDAWAWRMADDAARLGARFDADGNDPVDWSDRAAPELRGEP